ncbi:unnamed protein product [Clonostachys rosea]|uniref:RTA1 like protein n=1 Tax=Bionectria ochroleuca TaxID=29856 RepID=A0ABY6UYN0_BIOOC|nr:unnamed protein product [Clonostachys rosea]
MPTLETYNGYPLWRYIPSLPAAIIFVIIFAILTGLHMWKMFRHRMWFCIPFVIGGVFEVIGYIGRAAAYNATGQLIPYILQSIFLLLGPILFAATLYMTLSRIIRVVDGAQFSLIRLSWLTKVFVFGDVFSFLIQSSGAGLRVQASSGSSNSNPNMGTNIIVGGLIFQIVIFSLYIAAGIVFNVRFKNHSASARASHIPWQENLIMLYVTSAFVMIRNIFRVAEYAMGSSGYLLGIEWGVYVFDASLMTLTMAWFFWRYPSSLQERNKEASASYSSSA